MRWLKPFTIACLIGNCLLIIILLLFLFILIHFYLYLLGYVFVSMLP